MIRIIIETIIRIIIETIIEIISGTMNHTTVNHQRTTYRSRRRRVNDYRPTSDPTSAATSAASETTVDQEGDRRIHKGLESLGGR